MGLVSGGSDIAQLSNYFGSDLIKENNLPDAVPTLFNTIHETPEEGIPMHQWGHFQNKVTPYVYGSNSLTRKKHKKTKRKKIYPESNNEINNFAEDQFAD